MRHSSLLTACIAAMLLAVPRSGRAQNVRDSTATTLPLAARAGLTLPQLALAPQQKRKRRIPLLGADFEFTSWLDSKTRARFGATVVDISPGIGGTGASPQGELGFDLVLSGASRNQNDARNRFFLVELGPEFRRALISPRLLREIERQKRATKDAPSGPAPASQEVKLPTLLPYYGASLDAVYANLKVPSDGVNGAGLGVGGSVFAGVSARNRLFIEGRLRATTPVKGFNFSSAALSLGLRF